MGYLRMAKDIVMLSKYIQDVPEKKLEFPMHVSEKLDGVMADLYCDLDGTYHIRTRQGKPIPSMKWLVDRVEHKRLLTKGEHIIGELYHDYGLPRVENFNKISGRVRQEQEQATDIDFYVFDKYNNLYPKEEFKYRLEMLKEDVYDFEGLLKQVPFIGTVTNITELNQMFEDYMRNNPNAEGVVARPYHGDVSRYKVGRSYGFIKLVPKPTVDLVIKSIEEAKGDLQGNAGKVICEYNGQDIAVGLGSITHDIRRDMWLNPMAYIGRVVEIGYKDITSAGVMRMPVVKRFREDKDNG